VGERVVPGLVRLVRARGPAGVRPLPASSLPTLILTRGRLAQGSVRAGGTVRAFTLAPGQFLLVPSPHGTEVQFAHEHDIDLLTLEQAAAETLPPVLARAHVEGLRVQTWTSPLVAALCESLWQDAGGDAHDAFDRSRVATILHELARLTHAPPVRSTGGLAPWALRRVMAHLDASLADPVTLEDLARIARLSTYHFARAFKVSTGLPPHRWIQMRRIERAKELLAGRGMRVVDVAAAVGYENPSRFAKLFRRGTGLSPRCYSRLAEPAAG
jgi:AraC-like DNA-binding protein